VWIALDDNASISRTNARVDTEKVRAGAANALPSGAEMQLLNESQSIARLIVVDVKAASQPLTIDSLSVPSSLEDASDRNETLLVAVSPLQIRHTWNLGDESRWVPSKPDVLRMSQGEVRWIRPGIHHFKNLLRRPADFVLLEW
jgi:hypothetical protein